LSLLSPSFSSPITVETVDIAAFPPFRARVSPLVNTPRHLTMTLPFRPSAILNNKRVLVSPLHCPAQTRPDVDRLISLTTFWCFLNTWLAHQSLSVCFFLVEQHPPKKLLQPQSGLRPRPFSLELLMLAAHFISATAACSYVVPTFQAAYFPPPVLPRTPYMCTLACSFLDILACLPQMRCFFLILGYRAVLLSRYTG